MDLQTLEVAIVLGKRSVLAQALPLGALGLEDVLRFADRRSRLSSVVSFWVCWAGSGPRCRPAFFCNGDDCRSLDGLSWAAAKGAAIRIRPAAMRNE